MSCYVTCTAFQPPAICHLRTGAILGPRIPLLDFSSMNLSTVPLNLCELLACQTSFLYSNVTIVWKHLFFCFEFFSLQLHLMSPGSWSGRKCKWLIQNLLTQAIFSKCHISLCLLPCICITELSASLMLFRATSIFGSKSMIFCLQPKSLL